MSQGARDGGATMQEDNGYTQTDKKYFSQRRGAAKNKENYFGEIYMQVRMNLHLPLKHRTTTSFSLRLRVFARAITSMSFVVLKNRGINSAPTVTACLHW